MEKKKNKKKKGLHWAIWLLIVVLAAVLFVEIVLLLDQIIPRDPDTKPTEPSGTVTEPQPSEEPTTEPTVEEQEETGINLGYGMMVTQVGKYTGAYVEDGSDEFVNGVLMVRVTNVGEQDIQYAEFSMALTEGEAKFTVSTLPVGASVILLEQTRMPWSADESYAYALLDTVAMFQEPLSKHEDQLKIQALDGGLNVTNISGQDIDGEIVIYYKNAQQGVYYGGITYRVRLEGGIKAGEIKQIMSDHFSASGSEVVFITIS